MQHEFALSQVEAFRRVERLSAVGEGRDNECFYIAQAALIDEEVFVLLVILFVVAVDEDRVRFPHFEELLVIVQNGVGVLLLRVAIHGLVVLVDGEPGDALREARVLLRTPLDRGAGVLAARLVRDLQVEQIGRASCRERV